MLVFIVVLCVILVVLAACILVSAILFNFGIGTKQKLTVESALANIDSGIYGSSTDLVRKGFIALRDREKEDAYITSRDGLRLHAYVIPKENAKGTFILVHGWHSLAFFDFSAIWQDYSDLGYNLIIIDQRAHGESEGKYTGFGILERFDLVDWMKYANERFGKDKKLFLSGVSLGSSTVLMSLGSDELPENLAGAVADCGFTSPHDEFRYILHKNYHLPAFPFLTIASLMSKHFAGYGFRDYSTTEALAKTKIPVYLIHGEADNFVPIEFTHRNNAACASPHILVTVPGADHGQSLIVDRAKVMGKLSEFLASVE